MWMSWATENEGFLEHSSPVLAELMKDLNDKLIPVRAHALGTICRLAQEQVGASGQTVTNARKGFSSHAVMCNN